MDDIDRDGLVKFIPTGSNQTLAIDELKPFTVYQIRVQSCDANSTDNCNVGSRAQIRTLSAPPEGLLNPVVTATSPTSILIKWSAPKASNGIIEGYRVYRRRSRDEISPFEELIFYSTDSTSRTFTDAGSALRPFTDYEYQVRVSNTKGTVSTEWVRITTLQDDPTGVETPILEAKSAFAVEAKWKEPRSSNGIITSYRCGGFVHHYKLQVWWFCSLQATGVVVLFIYFV